MQKEYEYQIFRKLTAVREIPEISIVVKQRPPEEEKMVEMFNSADIDGNGQLSWTEYSLAEAHWLGTAELVDSDGVSHTIVRSRFLFLHALLALDNRALGEVGDDGGGELLGTCTSHST